MNNTSSLLSTRACVGCPFKCSEGVLTVLLLVVVLSPSPCSDYLLNSNTTLYLWHIVAARPVPPHLCPLYQESLLDVELEFFPPRVTDRAMTPRNSDIWPSL